MFNNGVSVCIPSKDLNQEKGQSVAILKTLPIPVIINFFAIIFALLLRSHQASQKANFVRVSYLPGLRVSEVKFI